jgi:hypothetical protein
MFESSGGGAQMENGLGGSFVAKFETQEREQRAQNIEIMLFGFEKPLLPSVTILKRA